MKKILSLFTLCALCMTIAAELRSADEALAIALEQQSAMAPARSDRSMRLVATHLRADQSTPAFYVFQRGSDDGFMLISAETATVPVLGYNDEGAFSMDNMPSNLKFWFDRYAEQIEYINRHPQPQRLATAAYPNIAPIIGTSWDQESPYNQLCPQLGSERMPTGCVATAMAQIMYKHKYPTTGTGSHSYTWNGRTLSANFGTTTYQWSSMLPKYTAMSNSTAKTAVATLMYHLGVATNMDYGPDGSSTTAIKAMQAVMNYFGYDRAIEPYMLDYHGETLTLQALANELQHGRPVFFSAHTPSGGGHAFVGEGMRSDGYVYINWGWGGVGNGYYALTLMDPKNQGTGGSLLDEAYTESVVIYGGIQPNAGGSSVPVLTTVKADLASNVRIKKTTRTGFNLTRLTNSGVDTWSGDIYLVITDNNGNIIGGIPAQEDASMGAQTYFAAKVPVTGNLSSLAAGNYYMSVCVTKAGENIIYPIYAKGFGEVKFPMTVTSDSIFFGNGSSQASSDSFFSHTMFIKAQSGNSWDLDMYTENFWTNEGTVDDALLRCMLHSGSTTSAIGTYLLDAGNTGAAGTIAPTSPLLALGYAADHYQYTPDDIQLTISRLRDNALRMDYYIEVGSNYLSGSDSITEAEQDWWIEQGEYNYDYADDVTFEPSTSMSVTKAATMQAALTGSTSPIPYLISGVVSAVHSTPTEMAQQGKCSFTITDPDATQSLRCTDMAWLNQQRFTGTELQVGDTVVVYAQLNSLASIGCTGHVYQHVPNSEIATMLPGAQAAPMVEKYFRNGVLYIRKGNKIYTTQGTLVNGK